MTLEKYSSTTCHAAILTAPYLIDQSAHLQAKFPLLGKSLYTYQYNLRHLKLVV